MASDLFEEQISSGQIEFDLFERMREAEQYGAASSIEWLISVVLSLNELIVSGRPVTIRASTEVFFLNSLDEFKNFCERNFPDANKTLTRR